MRVVRLAYLLPCMLVIPVAGAQDPQGHRQLYKWEDEQGRVELSDRPPAEPATPVEVLPLPGPAPADQGPAEDDYSIENQAERMEEERRQREEARAEAERRRQDEQKRAAEREAAAAESQREADQEETYPMYVPRVRPIRPPGGPIEVPGRPVPSTFPRGHIGVPRP